MHTGGHILSNIIEKRYPTLKAFKGYHFPDGPYVEFHVGDDFAENDKNEFVELINDDIDSFLKEGAKIVIDIASNSRHHSQVGGKADKPFRTIKIGEFDPTPCGGTHMDSTSHFKTLVVTKIKLSKGVLKVSYKIELNPV